MVRKFIIGPYHTLVVFVQGARPFVHPAVEQI